MIEQKQAIKDMIDFIAEFELWLEAEENRYPGDNEGEYRDGYAWGITNALKNYRRCKQRIEYHDEQSAHVLTAEQAEVLETIHESPANSPRDWNIIAMWLHEQGYIGTYPDGLSIRFFRAKSGRDALKTYQDSHNDE